MLCGLAPFEGPPTGSFPPIDENPICSDTGQLMWRTGNDGRGLVIINSPKWQAVVGHVQTPEAQTQNLSLVVKNSFAAVTLASLEACPIAEAKELLLVACGQVANQGQRWNSQRTSLEDWGKAPTVIEVITGSLVLKGVNASQVHVQPLDAQGRPLGEVIPAQKVPDGWQIPLGKVTTTWYLVTLD
jgi:hypothetical protein